MSSSAERKGFPTASDDSSADSEADRRDGERRARERRQQRTPKVVAFGGGTGMAALLEGLKHYSDEITAVVTVTDNGGSSGRLRNDFDMAAPGDIRNCLMALADIDPLISRTFQYRFEEAEFRDHSFGNLFITALTRLVGDFSESVRELNRLLNVRGQVIPATNNRVSLIALHPDGSKSTGEVQIARSGKRVERVELRPKPVPLSREIRDAIETADLFLFGPGSLYTSVLPNLLLDGLVDAIEATGKPRVYVCNLMTQPGETDRYRLSDHVRALQAHVGERFPDAVVAHDGPIAKSILRAYRESGAEPVVCDLQDHDDLQSIRLITDDFFQAWETGDADESEDPTSGVDARPEKFGAVRHNSAGLAGVIYREFLQPLEAATSSDPKKSVTVQAHGT